VHRYPFILTASALALAGAGLAQQATPTAQAQQDQAAEHEAILHAIKVRARALTLSREDVEVAALRAKLAAAEGHLEELKAARARDEAALARLRAELARTRAGAEQGATRRAAGEPAGDPGSRPAAGHLAVEEPGGLAVLGLAAAMLLGFVAVAERMWRLHRRLGRLHRLVPEDLMERLARGEQAYQDLVRRRTEPLGQQLEQPELRVVGGDGKGGDPDGRGRRGARKSKATAGAKSA
jgi:hypothetical protein